MRLRARLLLHKQDELTELEEQLDRIDREETRVLFLGHRRKDMNVERKRLIQEMDIKLAEYGT